jgi:hypothetical protein
MCFFSALREGRSEQQDRDRGPCPWSVLDVPAKLRQQPHTHGRSNAHFRPAHSKHANDRAILQWIGRDLTTSVDSGDQVRSILALPNHAIQLLIEFGSQSWLIA